MTIAQPYAALKASILELAPSAGRRSLLILVEGMQVAHQAGYAAAEARYKPLVEAAMSAIRHLGGHTGRKGDVVTDIQIEQRANTAGALCAALAALKQEALEPG